MSKKKLGVLIHGAGQVGAEHIRAYQSNPVTEVVAISSRTITGAREKATQCGLKQVALYDDLGSALDNSGVDLVSVCTPQHLHASNVIEISKAGKHIAIEKPVATSLKDLHKMRDAVRKAKVRTVVSFVMRWNPLFETIKAMLAKDAFGDPYYIEADYQHHLNSKSATFRVARKKSTGIGALLAGGCHAVDAVRWFATRERNKAAKAIEVFGYSGGYRKGRRIEFDPATNSWNERAPPLEYDDLELIMVRFQNGAIAKVSANYGCIMPYSFPLSIFGNKGTVKGNRVWSWWYSGQNDWVSIPAILPDTPAVSHHNFRGEIYHFVDCILSGRESHASLEDAINTHEIIFAAQKCYETKKPVKLPLTD